VLYRPSNYNPSTLLISMLITIERRASCSMFARSCKHPIRKSVHVNCKVYHDTNSSSQYARSICFSALAFHTACWANMVSVIALATAVRSRCELIRIRLSFLPLHHRNSIILSSLPFTFTLHTHISSSMFFPEVNFTRDSRMLRAS